MNVPVVLVVSITLGAGTYDATELEIHSLTEKLSPLQVGFPP